MPSNVLVALRIAAWAAAALLLGYIVIQHYQISALRSDAKTYQQAAATASAAADALQQDAQRVDNVQGRAAQKSLSITQSKNEALEEINHAPPSDDAPVAPVLRRTVNRLYGRPETGPADRDKSAHSAKSAGAATAAALPRR